MTAHPEHEPPDSSGADGEGPLESVQRATMASPGQPNDAPPVSGIAVPAGTKLDIERYTEREKIGEGGSSVVVRAFDNEILRDVAIKILKAEIESHSQRADRFAQEARITGQLEHPSIVPVYELGTDRVGRRFLCTKLVEGKNLEDTLKKLGEARLEPVHLAELLQTFVKVCDAVSFAHSRGVIHRDLKPRNVMVSDFGQVYVVDWGIALLVPSDRATAGPKVRLSPEANPPEFKPAGFEGTPGYAPVEQIAGHLVDARSDVFALGAILYETLAGNPPRAADIKGATIVRPDDLVSRDRVPPELSRIAMRALSHDPADRYQSVSDLKRDVESFQRGAWDLPRTEVPAGSIIMTEGEEGDSAYVILEGYCEAYRVKQGAESALRVMGPGDAFGETAVFTQKPRSASVKAVTDVALVKVTAEVLWGALGLSSWMGAFVRALAHRFLEADRRLQDLPHASGQSSPPLSWVRAPFPYPQVGAPLASLAEPADDAAAFGPRVSFPAGTTIIAEGRSVDAGYVVLNGRCVESRGGGGTERTRQIEAGDAFGELAVLSGSPGQPSAVTVRAATDVELLVVRSESVSTELASSSWMGPFMRALAKRLGELESQSRE
jgi:serine/threonine-protein kinase